jgi:hypothetical protein
MKAENDDSQKAQRFDVRVVILVHNNMRSLSEASNFKEIRQLKLELSPQALFSPAVVPSVYHIFGPLKITSRRQRFAIDDEVEAAVRI